ncbi:Bug family tripartite tricarboxylate transporter substrate binding protein [Phytomonospora endophytica]|uniref:Putative tricarboxylic transport membrane protein n=1 Tax=Phytomonospora endophytica TaxID=714109 RepID=A0A841FBK6_9ACTN|nr:tripartite tricarboxylate transporter substrate-binding protein [Phytomonospora endophytica]MBB6034661.1 putative tricarboxylic transport membrane protein [Phytomonospora endophytica]GIG69138.1 C4-dicarboxylate ABC transporter substrate-binding protein [Phytomonospora endophytica]
MRRRLSVVLAAALVLSGCSAGETEPSELRVMVPNPPGSGYDVTARTAARALGDAGIERDVEVFNLPGGGGTVGLRRLMYEEGNADLLMLMGLGVVGSEQTSGAPVSLADTTPIARLIAEPGIIVVRADSPYRDLAELIAAWRADPAAVAVGGGSSLGGPDHLAPMLVADELGIEPSDVDYQRYDGGGDLLAAILSGQVAFGVSGVSEYPDQVRSGQLRVLAVTGEQRAPGIEAPTLRESGIDVVFTNWRGIVAPPGLTAEQVEELTSTVSRLHDSDQWRAALDRYGWADAYLEGDEFGSFIAEESTRLSETLTGLGLG